LIFVVDVEGARAALESGRLRCPDCPQGVLGSWGSARPRRVRGAAGEPVAFTPARARCRAKPCRRTHVVLPASVVPRRAYTVEVIGAALLAGAGVAAPPGVPVATARRWRRAVRRGVAGLLGQACQVAGAVGTGMLAWGSCPPRAHGDLCVALEALGVAARVVTAEFADHPVRSAPGPLTGVDYLGSLQAAWRRALAARLRLADPGAAGRLAPWPAVNVVTAGRLLTTGPSG